MSHNSDRTARRDREEGGHYNPGGGVTDQTRTRLDKEPLQQNGYWPKAAVLCA